MSQYNTLYVGMDVHKDTIVVATVGNGDEQAVVDLGTISTRHYAIDKLLKKLQSMASELRLVYEAGPNRLLAAAIHRNQRPPLPDHLTLAITQSRRRPDKNRPARCP